MLASLMLAAAVESTGPLKFDSKLTESEKTLVMQSASFKAPVKIERVALDGDAKPDFIVQHVAASGPQVVVLITTYAGGGRLNRVLTRPSAAVSLEGMSSSGFREIRIGDTTYRWTGKAYDPKSR